ncbi:MAG: hypothetical protein ACTSUE_03195 [Promethearchaeota archaeon]
MSTQETGLQDTKERHSSWKQSFIHHLNFFGYWMVGGKTLREQVKEGTTTMTSTKKSVFWAIMNIIGCSAIVSLAIVGMIDGPEVIHGLLAGNFTVYSQTLLTYGIITYGFMFLIITAVAFVLPWMLLSIINVLRKKDRRNKPVEIFIAAAYGTFSPLFYAPFIYVVALLAVWDGPVQLVHLLGGGWERALQYTLAAALLFSIVLSGTGHRKLTGIRPALAWITPTASIVLTVGIVLVFLL